MIAGAQKAGTTSLSGYLGQHPAVVENRQREMAYFSRDLLYEEGYETAFQRYYPDGIGEGQIVLAKNVDVMYDETSLQRLHQHNPSCRIIVSLRDPVERAYSAYWYMRRVGRETTDSFEEAIASASRSAQDETNFFGDYLNRGQYASQIKRLRETFGTKQVQVLLLRELKEQPERTVREIFDFIGVSSAYTPTFERRRNVSKRARSETFARMMASIKGSANPLKRLVRSVIPNRWAQDLRQMMERANEKGFSPPPMPDEIRSRLAKFYRKPNQKLAGMIEKDISHWT